MCGIAGIVSFRDNIDAKYINDMTDVISYRGPDDEGAVIISHDRRVLPFKRADELNINDKSGKILLGHRRLSIIDLSADGHQPMTYSDSGLWITYNGEIYNYLELKEELISFGYNFKTKTDTEVILASYHKWGEDCLKKFNGMWSFVILDTNNETIFCTTDRCSIKPFYYYKDESGFYFSSEIKQLLKLPWIQKDIDLEYFINIFGYSKHFEYSDKTLVKGIKRLKTGYFIRIKNLISGAPETKTQQWHEFNTIPANYSESEKEIKDKLYDLLYDSVKLRLRSDVPIGTALSGGIDSSILVVLMDKILKETGDEYVQKTFTAGSEIDNMDETKYAKDILKITNAEGYFVIPKAKDLMADFEKMFYHIEMPFASSSCYASWRVYKLAKESGVTVTLDGQGSDEIFGGYDLYMYPFYQFEFLLNGNFSQLYPNAKYIKKQYSINHVNQFFNIVKKNASKIDNLKRKYEVKRIDGETMFSEETIEKAKNLLLDKNDSTRYHKSISKAGSFSNYLKDTFYKITLPSLLDLVDRNSMAHSIEARVPFLDYRLIEYAYSIPHKFKINKGVSKYILKEAFRYDIPERILYRPKMGFITSEKLWFEQNKNYLKEYVYSNIGLTNNLLNKDKVDSLFDYNIPSNNSTNKLWKVLSLCSVFKNFDLNVN